MRRPGLIVCELVSAALPLRVEQFTLELRSVKGRALRCCGGVDETTAYVRKVWLEGWRGVLAFVITDEGAISLRQAWDWQQICTELKGEGITVSGFARELNFATVLALSSAHIRRSPPLAGPVRFSNEVVHVGISKLLSLLDIEVQEFRIPPSKPVGLIVSPEPISTAGLAEERGYLEKISSIALTTISQHTGQEISLGVTVATGSELVDMGILTGVGYEPVLPKGVEAQLLRTKLPLTGIVSNLKPLARLRSMLDNTGACAVMHVKSSNMPGSSNLASALALLAAVEREGKYKGILVIVDLDGGELNSADEFAVRLDRISQRTPIVGYLRTAVSAGYLLSCSATEIVLNPLARIGGVGAVSYYLKSSGLVELSQISATVTEGKDARSGGSADPGETVSSRVIVAAKLFAARVKRYRKLSPVGTIALSDGRILDANNACTLGFADRMGGLSDALQRLSDLSGTSNFMFIGPFQGYQEPVAVIGDLASQLWRSHFERS